MKYLAVFGATSHIVQATVRHLAKQPLTVCLVARNGEALQRVADDLTARGVVVAATLTADLADCARHKELVAAVLAALPHCTHALIGHGVLPDEEACRTQAVAMIDNLAVNAISPLSLITHLRPHFQNQAGGHIAVISSVAGLRGRKKNYCYGAAKACVVAYLEGLAADLAEDGITVLDIRPGPTKTPMTAHMGGGPLFADVERVGRQIARAITGGRQTVVYTPRLWMLIMAVIAMTPRRLLPKLPL